MPVSSPKIIIYCALWVVFKTPRITDVVAKNLVPTQTSLDLNQHCHLTSQSKTNLGSVGRGYNSCRIELAGGLTQSRREHR